jgi:periplasmic protein CpxP/Spy
MRTHGKIILATVVALGLAGGYAAPIVSAAAGPEATRRHVEHIDGRVAFLKAELKITPAQEAEWSAVEKAMRDNAADRMKLRQQFEADKDKPASAVDRLARRQAFAEAHAKSIAAFATAFKSLYDHMSDDQRKAADALFQPHVRRG